MPRAYLRLDPGFDEAKESYPDGPYAALVATFCLAELQAQRGRFRSLDYLARLLGKRGRHVQYLVLHGDLTLLDDGRVYVDGWDEWQEGDWKVSERVGRIRNRAKHTVPVTPPVTVDVTVEDTVPVTPDRLSVAVRSGAVAVSEAVSEAVSGAEQAGADAMDTYWTLMGTYPAGRTKAWIEELVHEFGDHATSEAIASETAGTRQGVLSRARDRMRRDEDKAASARDVAAQAKREAEATAKRITPEQAAENQRRTQEELAKMLGPDYLENAARAHERWARPVTR